MSLTVAFQADGPDVTTDQKESIRRSMGGVTNRAPFRLDRLVLKNPGTSLLRVAFKADVVIKFVPFSQTGPCPSPMRRVAIGAFHSALYYPMVAREIEFGLNVRVTGETEIWFLDLQKVLGKPASHGSDGSHYTQPHSIYGLPFQTGKMTSVSRGR